MTTAEGEALEEMGSSTHSSTLFPWVSGVWRNLKSVPVASYVPTDLCLATPVDQCLQATHLLDTEPRKDSQRHPGNPRPP